MSDNGLTLRKAGREVGGIEIQRVEGGFILRWKEAELIPPEKRRQFDDGYVLVDRVLVRESLDELLRLARQLLVADPKERVNDKRWE